MSTAALAQAQLLTTDALIELYTLDATNLTDASGNAGGVYTWTPGTLAQRTGGTITAVSAGSQDLIVLDRIIWPSPAGGYTIQCLSADGVTIQNIPIAAFNQTTNSPTVSYVTFTPTSGGLPPVGSVYTVIGPGTVAFGGISYEPFPMEGTGFEWSGQGPLPRPKIRIDNTILLPGSTVPLLAALVITFGDLLGATITRLRTFEIFLDGQPGADSTASFEPDVYRIDRKSDQNKNLIEFELAASIDQIGLKLPARQVMRDACSFTYRAWNANTSAFVYGTCPYTGSQYYDSTDTYQTNPGLDACSKHMSGCLLRYPQPAPLPIAAFPGVGLVSL